MLKYEPANPLFQDDSVVLHLSCDYYKCSHGLRLQVCGCAWPADAVRTVMIIINGTFKTGIQTVTGEVSCFWGVLRGVVLKKDCLPDGL